MSDNKKGMLEVILVVAVASFLVTEYNLPSWGLALIYLVLKFCLKLLWKWLDRLKEKDKRPR